MLANMLLSFFFAVRMDAVLRAGRAKQPAHTQQENGGDGAADQTRDGGARASSSDAHPEKPEDDQPGNVDLHFHSHFKWLARLSAGQTNIAEFVEAGWVANSPYAKESLPPR